MSSISGGLIGFPNPVNEKAARVVAGLVVLTALSALLLQAGWLLWLMAVGFLLRVLSGQAEPDLRTGTLISLLQATSAWSTALPKEVRGGLKGGDIKRRAKEIAKGRWGSEAVRKAVEATNAAMMVAIYS